MGGLPKWLSSNLKPSTFWARSNNRKFTFQNVYFLGGITFEGKVKNECLAINWLYSRAHAKVLIELWRKQMTVGNPLSYIIIRLHSSLDDQAPTEFVAEWQKELITRVRVSR